MPPQVCCLCPMLLGPNAPLSVSLLLNPITMRNANCLHDDIFLPRSQRQRPLPCSVRRSFQVRHPPPFPPSSPRPRLCVRFFATPENRVFWHLGCVQVRRCHTPCRLLCCAVIPIIDCSMSCHPRPKQNRNPLPKNQRLASPPLNPHSPTLKTSCPLTFIPVHFCHRSAAPPPTAPRVPCTIHSPKSSRLPTTRT
jgi:hypothetical protein